MRPVVKSNLYFFQKSFEGEVNHLYQDVKGLMTIGVGNMLSSVQMAYVLNFKKKSDRKLAMPSEIKAEWDKLKDPQYKGLTAKAFDKLASLYIEREDIEKLVQASADGFEHFIRQEWKEWEEWPADAQMGMMSMAWALGVGGIVKGYPKFTKDCHDQRWAVWDFNKATKQTELVAGAAFECKLNEVGNPGVIPRNKAARDLFQWAENTVELEKLHWPEGFQLMEAVS